MERSRPDTETVAGNLHDLAERPTEQPHRERGSHEALESDYTSLHISSSTRGDHDGSQAMIQEVGKLHFFVGLMKAETLRQLHKFQMRANFAVIAVRHS